MIFRLLWGKIHIIIQLEHLLRKRRIVGEYTYWIVINMKSVSCRFHSDRSGSVRNDPVKLGYRKLFTKRRIYQIHMRKKFSGFSKRSTCTENPWYKLELGDVVAVFRRFCINCISYKIKSCHPKTFFINTVIVQRIIARHMSHTDDGIM